MVVGSIAGNNSLSAILRIYGYIDRLAKLLFLNSSFVPWSYI